MFCTPVIVMGPVLLTREVAHKSPHYYYYYYHIWIAQHSLRECEDALTPVHESHYETHPKVTTRHITHH